MNTLLIMFFLSTFPPKISLLPVNRGKYGLVGYEILNSLMAVGDRSVKDEENEEITENDVNLLFQSDDLFEGDILNVKAADIQGRNVAAYPNKKWNKGLVHYEISTDFTEDQIEIIMKAIEEYHQFTCIKFIPREKENDFVFIQPGKGGCSSSVGRREGKQVLNLGPGCHRIGVVEHELMHALGFWHEQSRPDRDDHVAIKWDNIKPGKETNFMKFQRGEVDTLQLPYDTGSVLHYGPYFFAVDPKIPTIIPTIPNPEMGQRRGFSELDLKKINRHYKCNQM